MDTGSEAILSQKVYDHPKYRMLFRRHVSRNATGRGRVLLEGLVLDVGRINMCFNAHPYNEEEAVQEGLTYWIEGAGFQPPTWKVLLDSMNYAGLAQRHIDNLQADLGITEVRQVLDHFRKQFITEVDASSIVFHLEDKGIISKGDLESITRISDPMQQNQILHLALLSKCTINDLKVVCDVIISVRSKPKMKALGRDMKTMLEGHGQPQPTPPSQPETGSEAILSQKVRDHSDSLQLLRRHVSRNAAGRGRALLEGLGLFVGRIDMCFGGHPNDEEAAVQQGLTYWIDGEGIQATWAALLEAMKYAGLAQQHIQSLKADLGVTEAPSTIEFRPEGAVHAADFPSVGTFTAPLAVLSQKVYDRSDHLALFRRHVSRNAAGRGRALLDGLELDVGRIAMCFNTHSYNEEEAVQQGLTYWIEGAGVQPPTWTVLLDAMNYAGLARRHVDNLQADLGVTEVDPLKEWTEVKLLGKGNSGDVLLCKSVNTGEQLVVRKVSCHPSMQEEAQRIKSGIRIFKSLQHDRIVTYFDSMEVNAVFCIFMEYMPGGSIHQLLHRGPLDEVLTWKYTRQILEGVAYLHDKRIVHRDIKGASVLLGSDGNVKLADFVTAEQLQTTTTGLTATAELKGSPYWIAPEVVNSRFPVTTKVDIWSVGCTVVEMLTGKPPLHDLEPFAAMYKIGNEPEKFRSFLSLSCSERVEYFLSQCFAVDPDTRMSAVELLSLPFLKNEHPGDDITVLPDSNGQDIRKFEEEYSRVVSTSASVTLKITKCTTIGPPRIGKTCLKHLLTGQEWDVDGGTASTDIMEAPEWVECYSVEEGADELWKLVSKQQQLGEVVRTVNSPHATVPSGASNAVKPTDDATIKVTDDTAIKAADDTTAISTDGITTEPTDGITIQPTDGATGKLPDDTKAGPSVVPNSRTLGHALSALAGACSSEAVKEFLENKAGKVLGETHLIHFIDTGGQAIYHDVHPVLITSPSVYLVVFSLEDFYRKSDEERLEYFRSDLIQRPLRSIYTFGRKPPQQKGHLQLHPEAPRIFIVGTHLDRILQKDKVEGSDTACKQFLLAVNEMIEKEISTKPYHQFVQYDPLRRSFWAVDNTQAGKKQDEDVKKYISTFRRMVQDKSMEMSVRVPLPWMLLKVVMEGKGVHYLSYSQLLNEACIRGYVSEHSPEADLDNMLKLFHILGLMYHKVPREYNDKKENSLVFINPDCLYSSTSDFLMAAKEEIDDSQRSSVVEEDPDQTSRKEYMLVDSAKVVQRIDNVVRDFLFDMHKVLCELERILMNAGQKSSEVVSRNLAKIQKSVEGNTSTYREANTLHAKYKILAKEMVFRLTNSIRQVLQGSMSESKKAELDRIMDKFWVQCRTTRRSIEVADFDHLLQLLSDLRIIAQVNRLDCYVIPVALPQSLDDGWQKDEIEEGGIAHEPLLFTLISEDGLMCYLPSGLFCCLISELVTELHWTVIPLGRTHVAFTHKDFTGKVHLRECESYIMVNVKAKPKVPLQVEDLHYVREQMYKTINRVHTVIYHTPDAESVVLGFQCTCADNAPPHFATYQEDDFESCIMCLLPDSTECPLTEEQLVWFP